MPRNRPITTRDLDKALKNLGLALWSDVSAVSLPAQPLPRALFGSARGQRDDSLTVVDVEKDGRAYASLRVGDGFVVRQLRIDGGEWQSPCDARVTDGESFDEFCGGTMAAFEVQFEREPPPKLFQGAARHGLKRRTVQKFTDDQVEFLKECFNLTRRMRDKEAWLKMKELDRFKGVDAETGRPLILTQAQIAAWFSRAAAALKKAGRAAIAEDDDAEIAEIDDDDHNDDSDDDEAGAAAGASAAAGAGAAADEQPRAPPNRGGRGRGRGGGRVQARGDGRGRAPGGRAARAPARGRARGRR